jgi:hypothetical protein
MRYVSILAEKTAADLFRKIDALDATINDRSITDGERAAATSFKDRLVQKLKTEFPGAQRPAPLSSRNQNSDFRDYASAFTRGMDEYDEYQRVKNDPTADRSKYRAQIERLKAERRRVAPGRGLGDTHATQRVKEIDARVRRIYQDMFPAEWKELTAKREKAADAARDRAWEKKVAAETEKEKAAKAAGLSYRDAGKMHPEALKAFANALKHRYAPAVKDVLGYIVPPRTKKSDLKAALSKLSPEDVAKMKEMVNAIHTNAYTEHYPGYTVRQKADVLSAFATEFDPNAAPKTGQSWGDFKAEYEPVLAKSKYRRSKWEKDKSLFDIFGQGLSAYERNEIMDKISRNLTKTDRAKLVTALQGVAPANKVEQARVNKLIALLQ